MKILKLITLALLISITSVNAQIQTGAENTETYIPMLKNQRVGVLANQTSTIGKTHLIDSLLARQIKVSKIFIPEHGLRGDYETGKLINNSIDKKTGIPIYSLYGKHKKPTMSDFNDIDVLLFDLQDVGCRFYTYINTLHYVIEACSQFHVKLIVLDRPNPNAYFVDGPVLENKTKSFVGMQNIPIVYGLTIGELAMFIYKEYTEKEFGKCDLTVIKLKGWNHNSKYELPIAPSPNLPNYTSIILYPSLCLFEGTVVSVGRGTDFPFQVFGAPYLPNKKFSFTPRPVKGAASNPKHNNKLCGGIDLRDTAEKYQEEGKLNLSYLIYAYKHYPFKDAFFNKYFTKLAGTEELEQQIRSGWTEEEIRYSWKEKLDKYKEKRKKYLLYD
ncbi:MAG: DUF1343 domain-containing protein [Marinifilaceae bacterium]|jgi:uncharacterized protein YbbC (DUF1343 family)|nr:DUF1343 domain-containing protein [Marinifilaceae bacterium]